MFGQAGPWNDVTTKEEEEEEEEGEEGEEGEEEELEDTYHLVLPSRFGELEFVTLVVHILRSAIRRACPKRLPSAQSLFGSPSGPHSATNGNG